MKNQNKNSFFLFCFSLLPGAGEMYLGFMKQGISLMSFFWGIIALCTWLEFGPLLMILPVLWFYSFFHVHNMYKMPPEKFAELEDEFILRSDSAMALPDLLVRFRSAIAVILILLGCSLLWNNIMELFSTYLPHSIRRIISNFGYRIPRIGIALLIVAFGIYLIRGKKKVLDAITEKAPSDTTESESNKEE